MHFAARLVYGYFPRFLGLFCLFLLLDLHVARHCGRRQPAVVLDFHVYDESPASPADDSGACQHPSESHRSQVMDSEIGGGDSFVLVDGREDYES